MLTIALLTCVRKQPQGEVSYAERTLKTTLQHLVSLDPIKVHIADDTQDAVASMSHVQKLIAIAQEAGIENITFSNAGGHGYGANYNLAMQTVHPSTDYILPLEDDWELMKPLAVDSILDLLESKYEESGCVRLGYLGYTQKLTGDFFTYGNFHWVSLDSFSAEPHIFAGHPRIETVEWARKVGPWKIGMTPGETEWDVAHRAAARLGVVWPISLTRPEGELFVHIGTVQSVEGNI